MLVVKVSVQSQDLFPQGNVEDRKNRYESKILNCNVTIVV